MFCLLLRSCCLSPIHHVSFYFMKALLFRLCNHYYKYCCSDSIENYRPYSCRHFETQYNFRLYFDIFTLFSIFHSTYRSFRRCSKKKKNQLMIFQNVLFKSNSFKCFNYKMSVLILSLRCQRLLDISKYYS